MALLGHQALLTAASQDISPTGLDASAAFGTASVTGGSIDISPTGLDASATFTAATVEAGAVDISPTGLDASASFGTATVDNANTIAPTGLGASASFGAASVSSDATISDVSPLDAAAAFGTASVTIGAANIAPTSLDASAAFVKPSVLSPTGDGWQFMVRARTNLAGTPDGQLFNVSNAKFLRVISETGYGELTIPIDAADLTTERTRLFDAESVIDFIYDGVRRFRLRIDGHKVEELGGNMSVTFMGRDFSAELDEGVVLPDNYPTNQEATRDTTGAGPAAWATLINDAQAAGMGDLLTEGFGANDSNSTAWPSTSDIDARIQVGTTLRAAADALLIPGEAEWWCDEDGVLQALPSMGSSKTATVRLRVGSHQMSRSASTTRRRVVNQALVLGTDGTIESDEDTTSSTAYGGRATVINSSTTSVADRQAIAAAVVGNKQNPVDSIEIVTRAFRTGHALWTDWDLGDTISLDVEGIRDPAVLSETARVVAYTVETDLVDTIVDVQLGDKTEILESLFDRRLDGVLNGQSVGMQQARTVADALDVEYDGDTGIDPTGLSVADRGGAAVNEAAIQVSWTAPAGAGNAQVVAYEVEVDDNVDVEVRRERTSQTNAAVFGLIPATAYDITVYALNVLGQRVGSVQQLAFTTASDSTNPAQVTGVQLLGTFSALRAVWDASTDADVENGRGQYRVQVDSDSGFGTPDIDEYTSSTIINLTGLVPQTVYFVRVAAIDTSGNQGTWSASVNTSAGQVGTADIEDDAVETTKIANAAITNAKINDLSADKINAGTLAADYLGAGTITSENITVSGTGYIRSSNFVTGTSGWTIDSDGGAEFQDVTVNGTITAGAGSSVDWSYIANVSVDNADITSLDAGKITTGTLSADRIAADSITASKIETTMGLDVGMSIQSTTYTPGTAGWQIHADGSAEFDNITARGSITAESGSFISATYLKTGTTTQCGITMSTDCFIQSDNYVADTTGYRLDENSFEMNSGTLSVGSGNAVFKVASDGDVWLGNAVQGSAPLQLNNDGSAKFTNVDVAGVVETISGGIIRTGAAGSRHVELLTATANSVNFRTGEASETEEGFVRNISGGTFDILNVVAPERGTAGGTLNAKIQLSGISGTDASDARIFADTIAFNSTNGTQIIGGQLKGTFGTAGAPAFTFATDEDTGIYHPGANQVGVSCNSSQVAAFLPAGLQMSADGSAAAPVISRTTDTNTGFYFGTDQVHVATGAGERLRVTSTQVLATEPLHQESTDDAGLVLEDTGTTGAISKYVNFRDSAGAIDGRVGMISGNLYLQNLWTGGDTIIRTNDTNRIYVQDNGIVSLGPDPEAGVTGVGVQARSNANTNLLRVDAEHATYTTTVLIANATRSANTGYSLFRGYSGNLSDTEFHLRGDGNAFADGSWTPSGADYGEYFETADGEPIEVGTVVALDGDRVVPAKGTDLPILGVVRPDIWEGKTSGIVGNHPSIWPGKYTTDEWGRYKLDRNGDRVVSKDWDPEQGPDEDGEGGYVGREFRPEWVLVGLLGQVLLRKGQPTGDRWIRMGSNGRSSERWMIR